MANTNVANDATSTLNGGITSGATSLTVATGEGARFPAADFAIRIDDEFVYVGTRTGDAFSGLTRGAEDSTRFPAAAHLAGATVTQVVTAAWLMALVARYSTLHFNGVALPQRATLNVIGRGVNVTDDGSAASRIALFDPRTMSYEYEEFYRSSLTSSQLGKLGWNSSGGSIATPDSEANHPGILQRSTGGTSGVTAALALGATTSASTIGAASPFDLLWIVRLNTNDANTSVEVGAFETLSVSLANGARFQKLDADTNWFRVSRQGGTETREDTGVAVSTDWVTFRIRRSGAAILFSVNHGAEASISTNLPTGALNPASMIKNSAASAKTLDHDYFDLAIAVTR